MKRQQNKRVTLMRQHFALRMKAAIRHPLPDCSHGNWRLKDAANRYATTARHILRVEMTDKLVYD